jgi:CheY-like chemotaxis protein
MSCPTFEPFFTTKESGKGTGLGLATVYGIVKQNGGFIWVYSEEGMGTTFKIYWPQLRTGAVKIANGKRDLPPRGSEVVLLVEDEKAVRESTAEFLGMCGYTVLQAVDGRNAIDVARAFAGNIDLMLTDVVMPQMSGSEAAKRVRKQRPGMKVLFVSGYAESRVLQSGVSGVTGMFLQKPFTLTELGKKIRATLEEAPESSKVATASVGQ